MGKSAVEAIKDIPLTATSFDIRTLLPNYTCMRERVCQRALSGGGWAFWNAIDTTGRLNLLVSAQITLGQGATVSTACGRLEFAKRVT